jgi:hypothetical protein
MSTTLNYYAIGGIEDIYKVIYEIFIMKFVYDFYFFFNLKSEKLIYSLRSSLNYIWVFFGFNSIIEIFFRNFIYVNNESLFILKAYILLSNLLFGGLVLKLIVEATLPENFIKPPKFKLSRIRHIGFLCTMVFILCCIFLSWAIGFDFVVLEINKKIMLLILVCIIYKVIARFLFKLEDDFQTNRFGFAEKIKLQLGVLNINDKIPEITQLRFIFLMYFILLACIPLTFFFFEVSKLFVFAYQDFLFN